MNVLCYVTCPHDEAIVFCSGERPGYGSRGGVQSNPKFAIRIGARNIKYWDVSEDSYRAHELRDFPSEVFPDGRDVLDALKHVLSGTPRSSRAVTRRIVQRGFCRELRAQSGGYSLALTGDDSRMDFLWATVKRRGCLAQSADVPSDICASLVDELALMLDN